MNPKIVDKIIYQAVDKLQAMGYSKLSFLVKKTEEGVYGDSSWQDFSIVEDSETPVVFSLLASKDNVDDGFVLSVMDTGQFSYLGYVDDAQAYMMDTKEFCPCKSTDELIEAFIKLYDNENNKVSTK